MSTLQRPVRKSLPLTEHDLKDLATLQASRAHRSALATLVHVDIGDQPSEAKLLHAVLEAGMQAVRHQVEEAGYARVAADGEGVAGRAGARRRRPAWADE